MSNTGSEVSMEPSVWDLLHNGRTVAEFWSEWSEVPNIWRAAFYDGDDTIEWRIAGFLVFFVSLHVAMLTLKRAGLLSDVLASRPTVVANQLHCSSVTLLALYLLVTGDDTNVESYALWQEWCIPFSMGYFCGDILWYAIPAKYSPLSSTASFDRLILVHHATILMCTYPVATAAGAELAGAGSALWAVRLNLLNYLCELSNPLMNYRWYLMQTLPAHRADFAATVLLLVATLAGRVVLLGWLLLCYVLPKAALFIEAKQVFVYYAIVMGHILILLLSLYWLKVLTKPGLQRMLEFTPAPKRLKGATFTFGTDMGRSRAATSEKKKVS